MKPSILFIVTGDFEALKKKGNERMIYERDEGGFFDKVITVHPISYKTRSYILNNHFEIYDIGFDLIQNARDNRILMYLQTPIHFFRVVWKTVRLIKKYHIDLIRATDPYWMGLFGYICSKICRVPFCVSIHVDYDLIMETNKNLTFCSVFGSYKLARLLERFILSRAHMIMPYTETLVNQTIAHGAKKNKIRVIPHGVDLSLFDLPQIHDIYKRFEISPEMKIVSIVSRLSQEKYANDFLPIARRLCKKRNDFVIIIAGDGKEGNRMKLEVAEDVLLKKHVHLVGFQPVDVCRELARNSVASICLFSGFSLIEAFAAGCPVVSYNVEWHAEVVKNNQTGFLVKENDIDSAAEALDWLLEHPVERNEMGRKAKALMVERHDLKQTSATKVRWYSELLKRQAFDCN